MENLFSKSDLEELKDLVELFEDMKVNEKKVICFNIINDLIAGNKIYTVDEILYCYHQLKLVADYAEGIEWFDNSKLDILLPKAKKLLLETKREIGN